MYGLETCGAGLREHDSSSTALMLLVPVRLFGVGRARFQCRQDWDIAWLPHSNMQTTGGKKKKKNNTSENGNTRTLAILVV